MTDEEIIKRVTERGDVVCEVDGYWFYWPSHQGTLTAHQMHVIAEHLDKLNKKWNETVEKETKG